MAISANLMRVGEFARRLGVSTQTVKRWLNRGEVEYVRLPGGERRIPEAELDRLFTPPPASEPHHD